MSEKRKRLLNRAERVVFAIGIVLVACLARYYRSLPVVETDVAAGDPNILQTSPEADSIVGFGGPTPATITLDPQTRSIKTIAFLSNAENREYWSRVENSGIFAKYIGKTPDQAASLSIDAVSGATISATAAQETLRKRLLMENGKAGTTPTETASSDQSFPMPNGADILVLIVLAANFFPFKSNPRLRLFLTIANVLVLGFVSYNYLSFARIAGWINNAPHWRLSIPLVLFAAVVAVAVWQGRNIYCASICPYGCAQDLATRTGKRLGLSIWKATFRHGPYIRRLVLSGGILALICGLALRPPEPFSLFQMTGAGWLLAAVLFVAVAAFIPRMWCRWLCPCGALLDYFAKNDKK